MNRQDNHKYVVFFLLPVNGRSGPWSFLGPDTLINPHISLSGGTSLSWPMTGECPLVLMLQGETTGSPDGARA